jgi:lipopolysaccharide biosynthesis regulator YciM
LLDRAEDALRKLEGSAHEGQALLALLAIYERSRDWAQATEIAEKLEALNQGNFAGRRAHYLCELAAAAPPPEAELLLREAMRLAPTGPRPSIDLAALKRKAGDNDGAFAIFTSLAGAAPAAVPLAARALVETAQACGRAQDALRILQASYAQAPSLDVLEGIVALQPDVASAHAWYLKHLEREPSLVAASKWVAGDALVRADVQPHLQRALDHAAKPLTRYRCAACGFEANQHFWQCPGCQSWDSYPPRRVEEL